MLSFLSSLKNLLVRVVLKKYYFVTSFKDLAPETTKFKQNIALLCSLYIHTKMLFKIIDTLTDRGTLSRNIFKCCKSMEETKSHKA